MNLKNFLFLVLLSFLYSHSSEHTSSAVVHEDKFLQELIDKGDTEEILDYIVQHPDHDKDDQGRTFLMLAILSNSIPVFMEVLNVTKDVNVQDGEGNTAIFYTTNVSNGKLFAELLLLKGAKLHLVNLKKETPLHYAVRNCNIELVKLFLEKDNVIASSIDSTGNSSLGVAMLQFKDCNDEQRLKVEEIIICLCKSSAILFINSKRLCIPSYGVEICSPRLISLMFNSGFLNCNSECKCVEDLIKNMVQKKVALHSEYLKILKLLLQAKFVLPDKIGGKSVISYVLDNCLFELVKFLIQYDKSLLKTKDGQNNTHFEFCVNKMLDCANEQLVKFREMAQYLLSSGANVNEALHLLFQAIQNGRKDVVEFLVENKISLIQSQNITLTGRHEKWLPVQYALYMYSCYEYDNNYSSLQKEKDNLYDIIQIMIQTNVVLLSVRYSNIYSALEYAACEGLCEFVELFIKLDAKLGEALDLATTKLKNLGVNQKRKKQNYEKTIKLLSQSRETYLQDIFFKSQIEELAKEINIDLEDKEIANLLLEAVNLYKKCVFRENQDPKVRENQLLKIKNLIWSLLLTERTTQLQYHDLGSAYDLAVANGFYEIVELFKKKCSILDCSLGVQQEVEEKYTSSRATEFQNFIKTKRLIERSKRDYLEEEAEICILRKQAPLLGNGEYAFDKNVEDIIASYIQGPISAKEVVVNNIKNLLKDKDINNLDKFLNKHLSGLLLTDECGYSPLLSAVYYENILAVVLILQKIKELDKNNLKEIEAKISGLLKDNKEADLNSKEKSELRDLQSQKYHMDKEFYTQLNKAIKLAEVMKLEDILKILKQFDLPQQQDSIRSLE